MKIKDVNSKKNRAFALLPLLGILTFALILGCENKESPAKVDNVKGAQSSQDGYKTIDDSPHQGRGMPGTGGRPSAGGANATPIERPMDPERFGPQ